jgi:hypothetical protein
MTIMFGVFKLKANLLSRIWILIQDACRATFQATTRALVLVSAQYSCDLLLKLILY